MCLVPLDSGREVTAVQGQATGRGAVPQRATFGDVFAVGEFRALWFSEVFSVAGDRLPWSR